MLDIFSLPPFVEYREKEQAMTAVFADTWFFQAMLSDHVATHPRCPGVGYLHGKPDSSLAKRSLPAAEAGATRGIGGDFLAVN
ncbi:MAG: hypothetical protein ABL974_08590 [Prosthecobacter sp.]